MKMRYSTYLRCESIAGGVTCSERAFVRAALSRIAPSARFNRQCRSERHAFIRDGLRQLAEARGFVRNFQLVPFASEGPEGRGYDLPTCRACGFPGTDAHEDRPNCSAGRA